MGSRESLEEDTWESYLEEDGESHLVGDGEKHTGEMLGKRDTI